MTDKIPVSEGEAAKIWERITSVPRPKTMSALDSLRILHNQRPHRVAFEIGMLKQPHLYIELEAVPC